MLTAPAREPGTDFESPLRALLIVTESELLAAHEPSHTLRSQGNCRADRPGFPESPWAAPPLYILGIVLAASDAALSAGINFFILFAWRAQGDLMVC